MNPFMQDGYLTPTASLNMLPIADGVTAKDLCASRVIMARLQGFLTAQGIPIDKTWLDRFTDCLRDPQCTEGAHRCVDAIAQDITRVLLTLKGVTPYPYANWSPAHWAHWQSIDRIYLAGGMLGTPLGAALLAAVQRALAAHSLQTPELKLADHPPIISIIGAARYAARFCDSALLFDLGHTNIKCGSLRRAADGYEIHSYPIIPSREMQWDYSERSAAEILDEHICDVITALYLQVISEGREPGDTISISIANYVSADRLAVRGGYAKLSLIAEDYRSYLANVLSERLGRNLHIHLIHDGTAGAYAVQTADWQREAFLGMGTSLSVGFGDARFEQPFPYRIIKHTL
ncbi:MAG: hypothetical protein IKM54_06640 [Butyricicoccus sp.]|nr:hypothetical protein [Butyricicoccus sp.]